MGGPYLTLDLGNSRLKGTLFVRGTPAACFELEAGRPLGAPLATELARLAPAPRGAAVACVADPEREVELVAVARAALGLEPLVHPDPGLELALRDAHTVGGDRLYAARAALALVGDAVPGALVLDAGTALTVDAVRAGSWSGRAGTFLGGAIAPGPELLARALASGAARLARIAPRPGRPALGRQTEEALQAGVVVGFEGAALHLARRVAEEADLVGAPLVLCGGARGFLEGVLGQAGFTLTVEPHLVGRGLLLAAGWGEG